MNSRFLKSSVLAVSALALVVSSGSALAADNDKKEPSTLTTFFALPKDKPDTITLAIAGQAAPVTVGVPAEAQFTGICTHCTLPLTFKVSETKKNCAVCGCAVSNAACIVGKDLKQSTWEEMLNSLPAGSALRVKFITPDKPESGVKSFTLDARTVLLHVSGLDGKTPADLADVVKAAGGGKAELLDNGGQIVLTLKTDYDAAHAAKVLSALGKLGAKLVKPADVASAK